jgi:hypothetical protein
MVISKDFKEFIRLLNENKVRYLVVGGYAVAFHGYPRYTKDLDLWIWLDKDNAKRLIEVLDNFGFGSLNFSIDDFLNPDNVIQLGSPPNRIDLLTGLDGVDFETCYSAKLELKTDNIIVNFIDLENLKRNKKASGRLQDLADLEKLE